MTSKVLNGKQLQAVKFFENITGYDFKQIEYVESGEMTFKDAYKNNVKSVENIFTMVANHNLEGC